MKKISHLKNRKKPRIVDISKKNITLRLATAISSLKFSKKTFEKINRLKSEKGEIINIATIAGIMATKKTSELIPLCHNIPIDNVEIDIESNTKKNFLLIKCTVTSYAKTGVEMEALTGVSIASLTVYDMLKSIDKSIEIKNIRLIKKSGGKSGNFTSS